MFSRRWLLIISGLTLSLIVVIWGANYIVVQTTQKQIYNSIADLPKNKVGLLLGTSKYLGKTKSRINPYFQNRIDAAVALYKAGKIEFILVSGDNGHKDYNEPELMKQDLIARGVPEEKIFMDFAGFSTLDSILRCRDIFGQNCFTIISQQFHNERAVYIANHKNMTTVAFNAADGNGYWVASVREKLARVKMTIDLVVNREAHFSGETILIK